MQANQINEHPPKPEGQNGEPLFDNRVQIYNEKTGKMVRYQPYAYHVFGEDKVELFERPVGSGNMFDKMGRNIGSWKKDEDGNWKKCSDAHLDVKLDLPVTKEDALMAKNETLEAELKSIRAEKEVLEKKLQGTKK